MENRLLKYIFLSYLFLITCESSNILRRKERDVSGHWGYLSHNGPATWGGYCRTGKRQSPINIQLDTVIVKNFPSFVFGEDYLNMQKFKAKNNGHTIYVALEDDTVQPIIQGGGLGGKFIFEQLHLHWESEHEFDGKRADLEMHLVHYNSNYSSFEEASKQPDGLVVLAVIFNESEEVSDVIENFFAYILDAAALEESPFHPAPPKNYLPDIEQDGEKTRDSFSLRDLLPKHLSRFFRYHGSLTTPDCGEVVQWTVFINRFPVSSKVLEALKTLKDHDGNFIEKNFRPPNDLNEREVYIQIKNYDGRPTEEFGQLSQNGGSSQTARFAFAFMSCIIIHVLF